VDICFSAPLPTDRAGHDYTHRGRLSADHLTGLGPPPGGEYYVCGPESFMADIRAALATAGIDVERVHTEAFGPGPALAPGVVPSALRPPHPPAGDTGTGPAITFARSGLTVHWRQVDASLLDLAEACDVPARWSCRTGVCHNCETALLSGYVSYQPEPLDPAAQGNVLTCCSTPTSDVVLDL
jgi:ferredoxin